MVVELGRQAGQFEMVEPKLLLDRQNLARDHAAGDDQQRFGLGIGGAGGLASWNPIGQIPLC